MVLVPYNFWGQFWGQIFETDSRTLQSNKCAVFVPLRNADTNITRFSHRKSPTNRYIRFTFRQEIVRKCHATAAPHTAPVAARNAPVWRIRTASASMPPGHIPPQIPCLWGFFPKKGFSCAGFARTGFTCTGKPALINTKINKILKKQIRILSYLTKHTNPDFAARILP